MNDLQRYERLAAFITDNKRSLFERIAPLRTRHVTAVMEDIYQSQNASAVVRTCDLCGIQDVHVIENRNKYVLNPDVTLGSSKWVDIHRHRSKEDNTTACLAELRAKGYRIIATSPRGQHITPESIELDQPLAICFGTELTGLSDALMDGADAHLRIPMFGFTESFNISASAAITLYTIMQRLRASDVAWQLDDRAQLALRIAWVRKLLHDADAIEKRLGDDERENS
jgi:tRNA (guanosine-2'-O-)-methyltransferase